MADVVFDLGGVVLNWQPMQLLQQVLPEHAPDPQRAQALVQGLFQSFGLEGDWSAFDRGTTDAASLAVRIAARLGLQVAEVTKVIEAIPAHLTPLTDTVALIAQLKQAGHGLYFLSNMPAPYAEELERSHAFFDHFEAGVFSCRVQLIKPEPAIFQAAQQRFATDPASTWFIDDVAHNIDAARRHGWQGVQFLDAAQCGLALRQAGLL